MASSTRNNDSYAWNGHYNVNRNYTINGLNQLTAAGATALSYDPLGNLNASGSTTYAYTSENRLSGINSQTVSIAYDAAGQLSQVSNAPAPNYDYVGGQMIGEFAQSASYPIARRYVYGPRGRQPAGVV